MTDTGANTQQQQAQFKPTGFKLYKYSFIVKNFTPSNTYPSETKNDKVYINLSTFDERKAFLADLKTQNVRAHESLYEYYVSLNKQVNDEQLTFNGLVSYLKNLVSSNEDTKNLKHSFKIINDNMGFKVVVSSFKLTKYLNNDKLFVSYKKKFTNNKVVRTRTFKDNQGQGQSHEQDHEQGQQL